ncbi:MAG: methyltransferase domain-containing protein [Acidimicrobiia bacterium]|nr:methyltransferase domain-containing protein [Acidimicrobiia bacterium]
MFFLRKSSLELLPVAMSGVRMGERALQIAIDDPALAGAIAAKVGLSGTAAMAVADDASAARAREGAARAGALVDVHVTPLQTLPFADSSFDVVVVHTMGGLLASMDEPMRVATLREANRVLRSGGRVVIIEAGARGGLRGLIGSAATGDAGATVASLTTAGFRGSRRLAEREGYRFLEGMKP